MKRYLITKSIPCIEMHSYSVIAENEIEAIEIIKTNQIGASDSIVGEYDYGKIKYEAEDLGEMNDNFEYEYD